MGEHDDTVLTPEAPLDPSGPDTDPGPQIPGAGWSQAGSLLTPLPPSVQGLKIQGQRFGRYVLLDLIAEGGMARVYRAALRDSSGFEKILAIKRMHDSLSKNKDFVNRFVDEARIASTLNHSNIVQVFDFGKEGREYYLAMEFVQGLDIGTLLKGLRREGTQRVPVADTLYMAAGFLRGLGAAHQRKDRRGRPAPVVHRDMSPQNVLVSRSGEVKVVDFGIAKAAGRQAQTQAGHVMGKVLYMAPEQAQGKGVDPRTDVFSSAAVICEMIRGRPLWSGDSAAQILYKVVHEPLPPLELQDAPPELEEILGRALDRDMSRRYANGTAMARELERLLHHTAPGYSRDDLAALVSRAEGTPQATPPGTPTPATPTRSATPTAEAAEPPPVVVRRPDTSERSLVLDDLRPGSGPHPVSPEAETEPEPRDIPTAPDRPLGAPPRPGVRGRIRTNIVPVEEVSLGPDAAPKDPAPAVAEPLELTPPPARRSLMLPGLLGLCLLGALLGLGAGSLTRAPDPAPARPLITGQPLTHGAWRLQLHRLGLVETAEGARLHLELALTHHGRPAPREARRLSLITRQADPTGPLIWSPDITRGGGALHLVFAADEGTLPGARLRFEAGDEQALELTLPKISD